MNITERGKLIAIEGIDGVGKNTQAKLLHQHIVDTKGECGFFSFPRYDTPTGMLVGEYLKSGRNDLDLRGRAKLYADDRLAAKEEIESFLHRGVDVVCDRYITSNIVYFEQFARMGAPELVDVIGKEIEENEFGFNGIPRIDQLITLTASLDHFNAMMESKAKRAYTEATLDKHEADAVLIKGCHELYGKYGLENGIVIQCDFDGKLLAIEVISEIVKHVYERTIGNIQPNINFPKTNIIAEVKDENTGITLTHYKEYFGTLTPVSIAVTGNDISN